MLDKTLVDSIREFGLTSKQARTYAAVITFPNCGVAEISNETGLYAQDIYKILIKLEKIGLVTRVESKPITVAPVDIEFALNKLVELQEQRIKNEKKNIQNVIKAIRKKQRKALELKEKFVILPAKSQALKNKVDLVFEKLKDTYDTITPEENFLKYSLSYFLRAFHNFAHCKVKTRILVLTKDDTSHLENIIKKAKWPPCDITIKSLRGSRDAPYAIVDGRELWVSTNDLQWGAVVFTDYESLVQIGKDNFRCFWENSEAKTIFRQKAQ